MKFNLILLSIFLTLFKLADASLSFNYGDFVSFLILGFFINDFIKGRIELNVFSKFWMYYLFILFLSSTINFTFFEGRFLNIFKTNFFSIIYFTYTYSLIFKNKINIKKFVLGVYILAFVFLLKTWPEMQQAWSNSSIGFVQSNVFESSLNLNSWGFILILFLIFSLYLWVSKIFSKLSLIFSVIFVIFIVFSFSRTAYSLTALILFWTVFYVNKSNIKNLIFPLFFIIFIVLFKDQLNVFNLQIPESALTFFKDKSDNYADDLVNTRFYIINIEPLVSNYSIFNPVQMLVGDGVSVQHSFISHSLIVTGILGFVFFIKRYFYAFKYSLKNIKKKRIIVPSKFLLLIILVVLINDFVTNFSSFLPFAAYLSAIITALFFAEIDSKTSINSRINHES